MNTWTYQFNQKTLRTIEQPWFSIKHWGSIVSFSTTAWGEIVWTIGEKTVFRINKTNWEWNNRGLNWCNSGNSWFHYYWKALEETIISAWI